jgi:N-terminal half of MaoC dehydratase
MTQLVPTRSPAPAASHMAAEPIADVSVRRFVEAFELDSQIFTDDDDARAVGHDRRIAPWSMAMIAAMPAYWTPGDPPLADGFSPPYAWDCVDLPGTEMMSTRVELAFCRPLRTGDLLRSDYRVVKVTPKRTRVGTGNFIDFEVQLIDQPGDLVAIERSTVFRYTPAEAPGPQQATGSRAKTRAKAGSAVPAKVGSLVPGASIGQHTFHLSLQRLIMCSAASRDFATSHIIDDAAQAGGAPRAYADMNFAFAMVEKLLLRWAGPTLRVHALGPLDIRDFVLAGQDVTTSGSVLSVTPCQEESGRLDITVSITISQPGSRNPVTGQARACVPADLRDGPDRRAEMDA